MMEKDFGTPRYILRLTLILFLITAITAALLGVTNAITEDRISQINQEKTAAAMEEVLPADQYAERTYTGDDAIVTAVYEGLTNGESQGYVVQVEPNGFGGTIQMVVGIDPAGTVTGVSIIDMSETSGLGTKAETEPWFLEQFVGVDGDDPLVVKQDIDALTSATVTSEAVTRGVSSALAAIAYIGEGE